MHFSKQLGGLSSAGPEISAFGSHSPWNLQPILDCFICNLKLSMRIQEVQKQIV